MDLNAAGLLRTPTGAESVRRVLDTDELEGFGPEEDAALALAAAVTRGGEGVSDEVFESAQACFTAEQLVELTCWICLENFYSRFNRTFRVPAQGFCLTREEPGSSGERP
jgi:alkylhydroperoxidase family enzyme